jgi:tripartite-type tricarboxylate transporter receptor subunit TctC
MNQEINKALCTSEVAGKPAAQGIDLRDSTPASVQAFVEAQMDDGGKVVRDNGIKAE